MELHLQVCAVKDKRNFAPIFQLPFFFLSFQFIIHSFIHLNIQEDKRNVAPIFQYGGNVTFIMIRVTNRCHFLL